MKSPDVIGTVPLVGPCIGSAVLLIIADIWGIENIFSTCGGSGAARSRHLMLMATPLRLLLKLTGGLGVGLGVLVGGAEPWAVLMEPSFVLKKYEYEIPDY